MKFQQKEIVLLPYPFTNQEKNKVRPAIVISNNFFNNHSDDRIMVPLTTVIKPHFYSVLISQEELVSGKLLKPSAIRTDKIFSIEKNIIIKSVGTINKKVFSKIKEKILGLF